MGQQWGKMRLGVHKIKYTVRTSRRTNKNEEKNHLPYMNYSKISNGALKLVEFNHYGECASSFTESC